jgi:hypothetical protein
MTHSGVKSRGPGDRLPGKEKGPGLRRGLHFVIAIPARQRAPGTAQESQYR